MVKQQLSKPLTALAISTLLGLFMGVLGPFGTYFGGSFATRLVYWVGAMWSGLLIFGLALLVLQRLPQRLRRRRWLLLPLMCLIASLPETFITRWLAFHLWPRLAEVAPAWRIWYVQTLVLGLASMVLTAWLWWPADEALPVEPAEAEDMPPDLIALQMEDHYVRIHTPGGSRLVLMTLGQAIAAAKEMEGLRTHRSWWVARSAVSKVEGTTRAMQLHLSNGVVAPVARSAVAALREAGWIAD